MVGSDSKIGERCSVKKSVIGKSCQIGDNVKIANSVIMGHVIIGNKYVPRREGGQGQGVRGEKASGRVSAERRYERGERGERGERRGGRGGRGYERV